LTLGLLDGAGDALIFWLKFSALEVFESLWVLIEKTDAA